MFLKAINNPASYYFFLITLFTLLISCEGKDDKIVKRTQFIMGTLVEITVHATDKDLAQIAIRKSFDEISRLENIFSTYLPNSELSKVNMSAGSEKKFLISSDLLKVIERAIHWGKLSDGALDISIGPAVKLWEFDSESPALPDPEELIKTVGLIDYRNVLIEGDLIVFPSATSGIVASITTDTAIVLTANGPNEDGKVLRQRTRLQEQEKTVAIASTPKDFVSSMTPNSVVVRRQKATTVSSGTATSITAGNDGVLVAEDSNDYMVTFGNHKSNCFPISMLLCWFICIGDHQK